MIKSVKIKILSLLLSILLLLGDTVCIAAGVADAAPFSIGQTLSGKIAKNGKVYYQFTLNEQMTITLNASFDESQLAWDIKDYNDKTYCSKGVGAYSYNSMTETYTYTQSVTLDKGTYYFIVENDAYINHWDPITYSIQTNLSDARQVSGTAGTISIGIRLKKGKSIQLSSILSGMSGKTTWKSSKKSVAKVSSKGKVTAKKRGKATITAKCNGKKAKIKVEVY